MGIKTKGGGFKPGFMADFAGGAIPAGWLECAGQAVSRANYAALFLAIGTTHGAGDGASTFNLPDCRGRAIVGKDGMGGTKANRITAAVSGFDGDTLGAVGGGESHTQTVAEMPAHSHTGAVHATVGLTGGGSVYYMASINNAPTGNKGSGGAHKNVQPSIVANKIIKF